jgi:ammonia channel protein AmtB
VIIKLFSIKKIGCILTGVFADQAVVSMAGDTSIKGGWVNGNVHLFYIYFYIYFHSILVILTSIYISIYILRILTVLSKYLFIINY